MKKTDHVKPTFPSAGDDASSAQLKIDSPQTLSPSYQLAYTDSDFLLRDELRPVRLQLELLKQLLQMSFLRLGFLTSMVLLVQLS